MDAKRVETTERYVHETKIERNEHETNKETKIIQRYEHETNRYNKDMYIKQK